MRRRKWALLALVGLLLFVSVMATVAVAGAIWPGEARLTAPLFCEKDKPDAFVVVDRSNPTPGETTYNFSLYCMGSRGQTQEIGWLRPSVVLIAGHAMLILALVGAVVLVLHSLPGRRPRPPADQVWDGT